MRPLLDRSGGDWFIHPRREPVSAAASEVTYAKHADPRHAHGELAELSNRDNAFQS
jgi:hypothetical protein